LGLAATGVGLWLVMVAILRYGEFIARRDAESLIAYLRELMQGERQEEPPAL
jgi:type IV secretory pathway TrbD component